MRERHREVLLEVTGVLAKEMGEKGWKEKKALAWTVAESA